MRNHGWSVIRTLIINPIFKFNWHYGIITIYIYITVRFKQYYVASSEAQRRQLSRFFVRKYLMICERKIRTPSNTSGKGSGRTEMILAVEVLVSNQ